MKFSLKDIEDKTKEEVIQVLEKRGIKWRLLREVTDGEAELHIVTSEYDMSRVNMVIEDGIVTESWYG